MAQPTYLTPRQIFQQDKTALENHRTLVAGKAYGVGTATALLQYQAELSQKCTGQYEAMSMGLRLLGAQEFLAKMWELGLIPEKPVGGKLGDLDHGA